MPKKQQKGRGAGKGPLPKQKQVKEIKLQVNFPELLKQWNLSAAKPLIEAIETKRNGTKLLCLVYNDNPPVPPMLTHAILTPLEQILSEMGKVPSLDLFLRCTGGITEIPWRIVNLLREFTDKFTVIVSRIALSGATHIAIAADELVMTPFSVVGSVDPTRRHHLLPKDPQGNPIPTSVEDLKHCVDFIREQLGESYPKQDLALIVSELFKYVNPLAIGALEQSYKLARLITRKCLESRREPLAEDQIKKIVEKLSGGYFSHKFLISRSDVESDLGLPVTRPDPELSQLIQDLDDHFGQQFSITKEAAPEALFCVGSVMQTADNGWVIASLFQKDGRLIANPWQKFN